MILTLDARRGAPINHPAPQASNVAEYAQLEKLGLPPDDAAQLAALAADTRMLVRVKVADDNDIAQMLECCRELDSFFGDLDHYAQHHGVSSFAVFREFEV